MMQRVQTSLENIPRSINYLEKNAYKFAEVVKTRNDVTTRMTWFHLSPGECGVELSCYAEHVPMYTTCMSPRQWVR